MKRTDDTPLPKPTVELLRAEGKRFDHENKDTENAMTWLFQQLPQNTEKSQILLKVAAINQLYSTNILAVRRVAEQIAELKIDSYLDSGSAQLVDTIAPVQVGEDKLRRNLSFASKYCSWHRPESYAIYDSRARECLWAYKRQFELSFVHDGLWEYIPFFDAVKEFRDRFDLHPLNFKEIDKFLFLKGAALIEAREQAKAAANEARTS